MSSTQSARWKSVVMASYLQVSSVMMAIPYRMMAVTIVKYKLTINALVRLLSASWLLLSKLRLILWLSAPLSAIS